MIRHISVNGFKTLKDFELSLIPGLNVLVGPNGSGKTNIISFLEFLGFLQIMNVTDAISTAGGAGSLFRKVGESTYEAIIRAEIVGTARVSSRQYLYYRYQFNIGIMDAGESITYTKQRLLIKRRTVDSIDEKRISDFDLDIEKTSIDGLTTKSKIRALNDDKIDMTSSYGRKRIERSEKERRIKQALDSYLSPGESIIRILPIIFRRNLSLPILRDLRGGQVYNIEPTKVKAPDDSAKKPGVGKDGSGLYSTLYSIQKFGRQTRKDKMLFPPYYDSSYIGRTTKKDILKYTKLANEWISDIHIIYNPFDKQLQIRVDIKSGSDVTVLPLSAMSDGTVKWICLITIILTNQTIFSIEEPENYLHPLMLAEIMSIMRTHMGRDRFILMSTHSETLLNSATPEEVIVVSYCDGKTVSKRISNVEQLSQEIRDTGFGLGYYYLAGSIEDE